MDAGARADSRYAGSRPPVKASDDALLVRAVEVYKVDRLDFAEAHLVACAESSGICPS